MDRGTKRPTVVEFFCGAGGMSLGLEQAGFQSVFAADIDPYHVAVHQRNFPNGMTVCKSVVDLSGDDIKTYLQTDRDIDLVVGGPPCQGFSQMGLRDTCDPRNSLVLEFARLILEIRPKMFVMENVPGMNSGDASVVFDLFLQRVSDGGYHITWPIQTLNSVNFGVPQSRERLFVLGTLCSKSLDYPAALHSGKISVWDAISDLPTIEHYDFLYQSDIASYDKKLPDGNGYARFARDSYADPSDHSFVRIWDKHLVSGCMRTRHSPETEKLYNATLPGQMVPGHKLPRLAPDGISPTLRAGTNSERGSYTAPRPIHPFLPRVITVREAARLHGYPDWFQFYPTKLNAYRQIGNSVCPPVARAIGVQLMKALELSPPFSHQNACSLRDVAVVKHGSHEKRIPIIEEFPKVLEALWREYYDSETKTLKKYQITVSDLNRAFHTSNACLPRIRPERFLSELSRQRRLSEILSMITDHGYTIKLSENKEDGIFVPIYESGTIEEKDSVEIRTEELKNSQDIEQSCSILSEPFCIFQWLEQNTFVSSLFQNPTMQIEIEKDFFGVPTSNPAIGYVTTEGDTDKMIFFFAQKKEHIKKSKILKILTSQHATRALACIKLSEQHLALCLFEKKHSHLIEERRQILFFSLS